MIIICYFWQEDELQPFWLILSVSYLSPTEYFVSDVLAGVHNAITVQLQGNDRAFCQWEETVIIMQEWLLSKN